MNTADVVVKLSDETRDFAEVDAVRAADMLLRSREGWKLICVIRWQEAVGYRTVDDLKDEHDRLVSQQYLLAVEHPMFLMGRTEEESERQAEIDQMKKALAQALDDEGLRTEQRDEARKELERSRQEYARLIDGSHDLARKLTLAQETNRRMETDLAKAREHIGSKAWGEIFPPPTPEEKAQLMIAGMGKVGSFALSQEIADGSGGQGVHVELPAAANQAFIDGMRESEWSGELQPATSLTEVVHQADGISVTGAGGQGGGQLGGVCPSPPLTDISGAFGKLADLRDGGMIGRELVSMLHSFNPHIRQVAVTPISSCGDMRDHVKITVTERDADAEARVEAEIEKLRPDEAVVEIEWVLWKCRP